MRKYYIYISVTLHHICVCKSNIKLKLRKKQLRMPRKEKKDNTTT